MSQPAFSSPTPAPGSRSVASDALRKARLIGQRSRDQDTTMRDLSKPKDLSRPGGRVVKARSHKPRAAQSILGKSSSSATQSLSARIAAGDPKAPRLVSGAVRTRRNAISLNGPGKAIPLWKEWIQSRWNPNAKFLNLERLDGDEFLKKHRLVSPTSDTGSKEAQVIFKIASQLSPEIETISLAHNGLTSGRIMSALTHYLPKLKNLSLEGNNLQAWKEVDYISGRRGRLEELRELLLKGNPVRELEYKNNRAQLYKSEVARRFPSLEILDGEPVARVGFDAPTASTSAPLHPHAVLSTFAFNMGASFVAGVDGSMVSKFLEKFFPLFDTQRGALFFAYAPNATFSFSANTAIPPRARVEGIHISKEYPNQRKLEWPPWLTGGMGGSRNLGRMGGLDKVTQSLHLGSQEAVKAMTALPGTRHDIGTSPEKITLDAFPVQQGSQTHLLVTVHGQFSELPSEGIRSFDRSFVLAIAPEGSLAKQNGWDVMILSDQLVVRAFSSHEAWRPGPMRVQAGDLLPSPGLQQALASVPHPQERAMLRDVILRTRLNYQYAADCLKNNAWDVERAIANFESVKDNLPTDAYLPPDAFLS